MNSSTQSQQPYQRSLYISIAAVFLVLLANYYWLHENSQRGTLGDMFGVANALFSGLAICGLVYTLNSQMRTIELHGRSLEISNLQAKYSIESFRLQALTAALQAIEQQIAISQNKKEKMQRTIALEEKKKVIESEIASTIEKLIKNKFD